MGMFGEVDLYIQMETPESADKLADALENEIKPFIESRLKENNKDYNFCIESMDVHHNTIEIRIVSGRYQNAMWQGEEILAFTKEKFKTDLVEFNGEVTTPESFIYYNADDE
jgi:hypothetical protein